MMKLLFIPLIFISLSIFAQDADDTQEQDEVNPTNDLPASPLNSLKREYLGDFSQERKFREQIVGKVVKLQGSKATVVDVADTGPQDVTLGKRVLNDSSYWCPDNCYLSIKFDNKLSFVKLGKQTSLHIIVEDKNLKLKLHSGYIKVLFKASDKYESMMVHTPNSTSKITNAKTLFIYNNLFQKTTVINYKGEVDLMAQVKSADVVKTLGKLTYADVEGKNPMVSEPQYLRPGQLQKLHSAFDIDTKKLD